MSDRTRRQTDASRTGDIGQVLSSFGDAISGMLGGGNGSSSGSNLPSQVQAPKEAIDQAAGADKPAMRSAMADAPAGPDGGRDGGGKGGDEVQVHCMSSHPVPSEEPAATGTETLLPAVGTKPTAALSVADRVELSVEQAPFTLTDPEDIGVLMQQAVPAGAFRVQQERKDDTPAITATDPQPQSQPKDEPEAQSQSKTEISSGPPPAARRGEPKVGDMVMNAVKHGFSDAYKAPHSTAVPAGQENKDVMHNAQRVDKLDDPVQRKIYEAETTRVSPGSQAAPDLTNHAQTTKEAPVSRILGVERVDETGTHPHGKPDKPIDPTSSKTDRFSAAASSIIGPGRAQAKEPTGKEVKDAQQEIIMHDPGSGRVHIAGQDTNMGYAVDDPRHPQNVGRVSGDASLRQKVGEKAELAVKGMYDDVTGGPGAGKDSAGIPGGLLHNFKSTAGDVKETAQQLPEKVEEASGTAAQIASSLGDYVVKKMKGAKEVVNTTDTTSVAERMEQQLANVERRRKQLEATEANPWGDGHEKQLKSLTMDEPPAAKRETLLDHILHPFSRGDVNIAKKYSKNYEQYKKEKGDEYDPVGHMRASAESDPSKLPASASEAEQANVDLSEGMRSDRTAYIMERAAKAGHEHPDPPEQQKKNWEEQVAQHGYQVPHPAWRSQPTAPSGSEGAHKTATQHPPLSPKTVAEKLKERLSHLAELGKEVLEARGGESRSKTYDGAVQKVKEHEVAAQQLHEETTSTGAPAGPSEEGSGEAGTALPGVKPRPGSTTLHPSQPTGMAAIATSGNDASAGAGAAPKEEGEGVLMKVGKGLAHLAEALEPHAKHGHGKDTAGTRSQVPARQQVKHTLEQVSESPWSDAHHDKPPQHTPSIMSREEHSATKSVASSAGKAVGTVQGLSQVVANRFIHMREQLAEHAPNIPDVPYTSTDQILQESEKQQQQEGEVKGQ